MAVTSYEVAVCGSQPSIGEVLPGDPSERCVAAVVPEPVEGLGYVCVVRPKRPRWVYIGRRLVEGVECHTWRQQEAGVFVGRVHAHPVATFWPEPAPGPFAGVMQRLVDSARAYAISQRPPLYFPRAYSEGGK